MKALIITGIFATDQEVFYPLYRMQEEGWEVDIAVKGGLETVGEKGIKIKPTMDIPHEHPKHWDCLILPGGAKAMEYMRQDKHLIEYISFVHVNGLVIGSICHGAQLLVSAGLVKYRKISGYYSIKDDITNAGGEFVDAPFVTDDRIVSCPHYKHLGPWMHEVISQVNYHAKQVY